MESSLLRLVFPLEGQRCSQQTSDSMRMSEDGSEALFQSQRESNDSFPSSDEASFFRLGRKEETETESCILLSPTKELSDDKLSGRRHLQSLLLQAAVSAASQQKTVLFISTRAAIDEELFLRPHDKWAGSPVVHRMKSFQRDVNAPFVRFVFPKNGRELCRYLAALGAVATQSPAEFPDVILLNAVETFLGGNQDRQEDAVTLTRILTLVRHLSAVALKAAHPLQTILTLSPRFALPNVLRLHLFANEVWSLSPLAAKERILLPWGGGAGDGDEVSIQADGIGLELCCVSVQPCARIRFRAVEAGGQFRYFPVSVEKDLK